MQQNNEGRAEHSEHESNAPMALSRPVPPTLLRIYADNQDKRAICIFWVVFFVVIIAISIASAFLPSSTIYIKNQQQLRNSNLKNCSNPSEFDSNNILKCNPYDDVSNMSDNKVGVAMINLIRQNQFAVVYYEFYVIDSKTPTQSFKTDANISYHTLSDQVHSDGLVYYHSEKQQTSHFPITVNVDKASKIYGEDGHSVLGYRTAVFVSRNFKDQSFVLILTLQKNVTDYKNIADVSGGVLLINPAFTRYSFAIRYVFFAASLIAAVIYIIRFRKIPINQRIVQQKLIALMSILLVFFNDPFYPITVLNPNKASSYFSVFFVINFVIFLIFFWIMFLDRIYYEDGQKQTQLLNWKRIGYIVITYILVLVLYTLFAFDHIEGLPIIPAQDLASNKFIVIELIALFFVLVGFAYIVVSYIRLCIKVDQMLWRNQLFLFFSVFFIVIIIALFFLNGFQINSLAGNRILLLYTAMNMYTFYLQYMYSITPQQTQRAIRGQYQNQGGMLLQVGSGDGDCVDLQFDDMPPGTKFNTNQKLNDFVNKNYEIQEKKKISQQLHSTQNKYYNQNYDNNYKKDFSKEEQFKIQPKINLEDDKQTDFFNQYEQSQQNQQKINSQVEAPRKKEVKQKESKDEFEEFSLDN